MSTPRFRKRLLRFRDAIHTQCRVVLKGCFALNPHEQLALALVIGLLLLGLTTQLALRTFGPTPSQAPDAFRHPTIPAAHR